MSFLHLHLLTDSQVTAIKRTGVALATAAGSGLSKAVTLAAQAGNPIGAAALAAVTAAEQSGKAGADKKIAAVTAVAPIVVAEAAKGGTAALLKDAEVFAGLVIEEVVSTLKQTPVVMIGEAVLEAVFGTPAPAAAAQAA